MTGKEFLYMEQAYQYGQLSSDGVFTKRCHKWLEKFTGSKKALLTHSCTAALEIAAILIDIQPGDEIIMPSYTFTSTANAFVLRGGVPVFVDIREDTLNMDEGLIEDLITSRTRAIVPVHYAGVACEMDVIMDIAQRHNLFVIEDAAQGFMSTYKGSALGSIGHFGCLSFHETKNIISGEGGALLINDDSFVSRSEIIREKGTNRAGFIRGEVNKYTWMDIGSSYSPSELIAAFLYAQMEEADYITKRRVKLWNRYHNSFKQLESDGYLRRPIVTNNCQHNAHMYYFLLNDREKFIANMKANGISCVFHYIPLHSSPAGKKFAKSFDALKNTDECANSIVRIPLWIDLSEDCIIKIIDTVIIALSNTTPRQNKTTI
jgi:dTDP-4-amino-4,6-dideoxygalactose transaminase